MRPPLDVARVSMSPPARRPRCVCVSEHVMRSHSFRKREETDTDAARIVSNHILMADVKLLSESLIRFTAGDNVSG